MNNNDVFNFANSVACTSINSATYTVANTCASKYDLDQLEKFVKDKFDEKFAEPEVRLDQRTALDATKKNISAIYYENGRKTGSKCLMSNIEKVEVYNENTIKITFANGDVQTATAQNGDKFSFDTGVTICLMKEMLGKESSQILGKLIDYSAKIFNEAEKAKQKAALEEAERLEAKKRQKERMDRRWAKKRAKEKEARIQEMTEAIVRANGVIGVKNK